MSLILIAGPDFKVSPWHSGVYLTEHKLVNMTGQAEEEMVLKSDLYIFLGCEAITLIPGNESGCAFMLGLVQCLMKSSNNFRPNWTRFE